MPCWRESDSDDSMEEETEHSMDDESSGEESLTDPYYEAWGCQLVLVKHHEKT